MGRPRLPGQGGMASSNTSLYVLCLTSDSAGHALAKEMSAMLWTIIGACLPCGPSDLPQCIPFRTGIRTRRRRPEGCSWCVRPGRCRPIHCQQAASSSATERAKTHRDARVVLGRVGRDAEEVVGRRSRRATAGHGELGALGVELGRVGLVQSEQLVADQVVAGGKVLGDLAAPFEVLENQSGPPALVGS